MGTITAADQRQKAPAFGWGFFDLTSAAIFVLQESLLRYCGSALRKNIQPRGIAVVSSAGTVPRLLARRKEGWGGA